MKSHFMPNNWTMMSFLLKLKAPHTTYQKLMLVYGYQPKAHNEPSSSGLKMTKDTAVEISSLALYSPKRIGNRESSVKNLVARAQSPCYQVFHIGYSDMYRKKDKFYYCVCVMFLQ